MKKLILSLILAASLVSAPVSAQQGIVDVIHVAKGNGTDIDVVKARLVICREIAKDFRPETVDQAVAWMQRNGFTEDQIIKTQLVCFAYFQGIIDLTKAQSGTTY